jgi:acyl-CoA synthetase (AMP-forming)/AMP-acid ligase II
LREEQGEERAREQCEPCVGQDLSSFGGRGFREKVAEPAGGGSESPCGRERASLSSPAVHLWSLIERAEALWPRKTAVVDGARRVSYAELARRARALAGALRTRGVRAGERVAILDHNSLEYVEAYFAVAGLGAILVPLNPRLAARELAAILGDAGARVLLARGELSRLAEAAREAGGGAGELLRLDAAVPARGEPFEPAPVEPAAVAHLYYTSGTTGRPKGVMLTHANVWVHSLAAIGELGLTDADRWAHVAPMFHLADAWATFAVTWVGGTHVVARRFDPGAVLDSFERERVTITNLIPTMLARLVREPSAAARDFGSLRRILSGGAPIAPELVREVERTFRCEYVQTYGMTETSPYLTLSLLKEHLKSLPPEDRFRYRAKTGRPFAAVELEVVGDDGRPVPRDGRTVGEIRARGPTVTPGYWNQPEATRDAFAGGWLKTGDLATVDAEGYLQIVDRAKDVIITGGEKVYSTEVEHVLAEHPAVLEAAVFGEPDLVWGESVRAAVALERGARATEAELIDFCRARLAHFKCPSAVHFLPELPKTGTAKVRKSELRERFRPTAP